MDNPIRDNNPVEPFFFKGDELSTGRSGKKDAVSLLTNQSLLKSMVFVSMTAKKLEGKKFLTLPSVSGQLKLGFFFFALLQVILIVKHMQLVKAKVSEEIPLDMRPKELMAEASSFDSLPKELFSQILKNLREYEITRVKTVSKFFNETSIESIIQHLNENPVERTFVNLTAEELLAFLRDKGAHLKSLNIGFRMKEIDENKLKEMIECCPNLEHLNVSGYHLPSSFFDAIKNPGKLESLDLRSTKLSLKGIEELKNLKNLNLWGSTIQDMTFLGELKNLEVLDLGRSRWSRGEEAIEKLENLKILKLSEVCFKKRLIFLNLKNLEFLDLNYAEHFENSVEHINDEWLNNIGQLENLTTLKLKKGKFKNITPLLKLHYLRDLNMSHNENLTSEGLDGIGQLQNLRSLNLKGCSVRNISPLLPLKNLNFLNLSQNYRLVNEDLIGIEKLENLKCLLLNRCDIRNISSLLGLINVEVLDLSCRKLKISSLSQLSILPKLKNLIIKQRIWKVNDFMHIAKLKNLESLDIRYGSLSKYTLNQIKEELLDLTLLENLKHIFTENASWEYIFTDSRLMCYKVQDELKNHGVKGKIFEILEEEDRKILDKEKTQNITIIDSFVGNLKLDIKILASFIGDLKTGINNQFYS